ncbi:MAG: 6-pyruvoyl-tetrahydropterin synthase-related protein [Candidatus Aenigmatarchaeota archaeon]
MKFENFLDLLIIFIAILIVFSPLFFNGMPRTDAISFYFRSWFIYKNLQDYKKIFEFNDLWYQGTFLYTFYPPLSFYIPAILKFLFSTISLFKIFNLSILLYVLIYTLSFYFLLDYFEVERIGKILIPLFSVTIPRITTIYSFTGAIPSLSAFSIFPLSTFFLLKLFDNKDLKNSILFSISFSTIFLFHHTSSLFYFIAIFIPIFLYKIKEFDIKLLKLFIFTGISILVLISFWFLPFIAESKYFNPGISSSFNLRFLFVWVDEKCITYECLESFSIFIWIFATIGVFLSFFKIKVENSVLKINLKKIDQKTKLIFVIVATSFLILLIQHFDLHKNLPFLSQIRWERITFLLIFPLSLLLVPIFKKENLSKEVLIFVSIIFLATTIYQSYLNYVRSTEYLSELAAVDESPFSPLYNFLRNKEFGRIHSYGIYYPTFHPSLAIKTEMPVISGWYHEGDYKYYSFVGKIEDLSGEAQFLDKISKEEFLQILNLSGAKYIITNVCSKEGYRVALVLINETKPIAKFGDCIIVFETKYNSFSDPELSYNRKNPQFHEFYNLEKGGYIFKFTFYPYWKGYCDNTPVKIEEKNYLIFVNLENGCKKFILSFEFPKIYTYLKLISLLYLIFLVAFLIRLNKIS